MGSASKRRRGGSGRGERSSRRRHRDAKKDRGDEPGRSSRRHSRKRGHEHSSRCREVERPLVSANFSCHLCGRNHWTVDCPKVLRNPEEYPLVDRRKGCWQCGQRGHNAGQCKKKKYRCKECGGLHDTKDCIYDHVPEEWCEFVDPATRHVFYANGDESEVQWMPPTHELDVVLWYCPPCRVLNPSVTDECLKCHAARPATLHAAEDEEESSSSSSSSSSDSESDSESDEEDSEGEGLSANAAKQ